MPRAGGASSNDGLAITGSPAFAGDDGCEMNGMCLYRSGHSNVHTTPPGLNSKVALPPI
jgi:hypothetical protein